MLSPLPTLLTEARANIHYHWAFYWKPVTLHVSSAWLSTRWEDMGAPRSAVHVLMEAGRGRWTVSLLHPQRSSLLECRSPLPLSRDSQDRSSARYINFPNDWVFFFLLSPSIQFFPFFPPLTPSALDFMNLLNWRWWGTCGTLSYWFAGGFSVVGNTSGSLG